ncbi:Phosphorylated ctd interacting factor 1, ww domain, partial [Globisporangium splendens]
MDPLEAILASMARATGNAPVPTTASTASSKTSSTASQPKKRGRDASSGEKDVDDDDALMFPDHAGEASIWNPRVMQKLSDATAQRSQKAASKHVVTPPMEIARQQTVRMLCNRIKRASEEMGIPKLPNSTYETWQFTSRLTVAENDPLIPHAGSDYTGLLEELLKAGASRSVAIRKCKELTKESERLLRKFVQQDFSIGKKHVKTSVGEEMVQLTYGNSTVKLSSAHYKKLQDLYERHRNVSVTSRPQEKRAFENALFSLLLRYDSLDGGGFQAALNEECFDALLKHFDCKMECFASPLNCRYGRFCSAFLDTDHPFGSVGSFFEFSPRSGCYEANPPFIPKLIKRMADHMTALLDAADGPLAFIIIIPAWNETQGWQQLNKSRYNQKHVLISQKDHGYCEGKQHIRKTRWRIASFDTSVFFWQNSKAMSKWKITQEAIGDLKAGFLSKQADERDTLGLRKSGKRVKTAKTNA